MSTPDTEGGDLKYRAFISYSRIDRVAARDLQARLERYVLPQALRLIKPGLKHDPRPLKPVFRDEDELVPGQDLPRRIRLGLEGSEYLLVLCSPAAAASEWVEKEILDFCALGKGENILAIVVGGVPHAAARGQPPELECLPDALRFELETDGEGGMRVTGRAAEPLWVDWRAGERTDRTMFLRVVAGLLSLKSFDELIRRDAQAQRRRRAVTIAAAASVAIVVVASIIGYAAQARHARMQESRTLADLAHTAAQAKDYRAAARYAIAGVRRGETPFIGFDPADAEAELANAIASAMIVERTIETHSPIAELSYAPDSKRVLVAGGRSARFWDTLAGTPVGGVMTASSAITQVALSPDGGLFALASDNGAVQVWDARAQTPVGPSLRCTGKTGSLSFSADGARLYAGGGNTICQWSSRTGAPVRPALTFGGHTQVLGLLPGGDSAVIVNDVAVAKDADLILASSDTGDQIARTATTSLGFWGPATASRDGRKIVTSWSTADQPAEAVVWDRAAPRSSDLATENFADLGQPVFTADGSLIAGIPTNYDNKLWLQFWTLDGKWADIEAPPLSGGAALDFSPDGRRLAVAPAAGAVQIWRPFRSRWADAEPLIPRPGDIADAVVGGSSGPLYGAIFTPDGREGVVVRDGVLKILGPGPGRAVIRQFKTDKLYEALPNFEVCLALSQDGKRVANCEYVNLPSCSRCVDVVVREVSSGDILLRKRFSAEVDNVAFGSAGKSVVVVWEAGQINYMEHTSTIDVIDLKGATIGHIPPVANAIFARLSPDGRHVATKVDNAIQIWDLKTGRAFGPLLAYPDEPWDFGFEGDDRLSVTVTAAGDSVVRRAWRLDPAIELRGAALVRRACDVVLPGAMSRRTPVELKSAPMLDRVHELDACA
jgi:WD40 repeat protein